MTEVTEEGLVTCVEAEEEDRISKLPEHLIDSILERLPFEEVVKTSIISKNWRYKWTAMRELVFDKHFSKRFAKNELIRIINQVLNLHNGSISKFHLHIPNMALDCFQEIDQCMLLLSRNGVRELILTHSKQHYEVSSHVFSCLKLTKLTLTNCFVKLPLMFQGFPNLEDLHLRDIDFGGNLGGTEINLPQLKVLSLHYCIHVHNFNIKATKMHTLDVLACHYAMLLPAERINLAKMLNNFPRVELLTINCAFLKFVIEEKIPKWLPHAVNSLKHLHMLHIQLGDLCELHGVLCLLRNSPNLENLRLVAWKQSPGVDVGPASNHLEAPNSLEYSLNQLQTVHIVSLEVSRPDLLFIKLLLAHSPSLKEFTITLGASKTKLDISKDL